MNRGRSIFLPLAVFVLVGAPLVLYVWKTLSELLSGRFDAPSFAIALLLATTFLSAASLLGAHLRALEPHPDSPAKENLNATARP